MRRIIKIFLWFSGIILVLVLGLHFLITFRSKDLVNRVVDSISGGTYVAETKAVRFNYFPAGITVVGLSVKPLQDTGKQFFIKSNQIDIRLTSLLSILLNKKMSVELLRIEQPEISIKGEGKAKDGRKPLPESVADMQKGLFETFSILKVKDAMIKDGSFKLQTGPQPGDYFSISHVYLDLKKIVLSPDADEDGLPEFEGDVVVGLKNPGIHFDNAALQVQVGMLEASNIKHALTIDSMRFRYAKSNEQVDTVNLSKITINRLNWHRFLKEGAMELDSVIIATGETSLNFYNPKEEKKRDSSFQKQVKLYIGPSFLIHYLGITNVSYTMKSREWIKSREDNMVMHFNGDSLWLKNLSIASGKYPALDVEALKINFTNYSDGNQLKTYKATLGAIEVSDNTLVLKNYQLQALGGGKYSANNKVILPELRLQGYSLEDLLLRRLIADKLVINKPEIVLDILEKKAKKVGVKKNLNTEIGEITAGISKKVSLNEIAVNDASIILQPKGHPEDNIVISGLSININGRKALSATSFTDIMQSVSRFTTEGFRVSGKQIDLVVSDMKLLNADRGLYFGRIQGTFGTNAKVDLKGVSILNRNQTFDVTLENGLHASDIIVESGTIDIMPHPGAGKKSIGNASPPPILADFINLQNIVIRMHKDGKMGASSSLNLTATGFSLDNGIASWNKLFVAGNKNEVSTSNVLFKAGSMTIEQPGSIAMTNATGELSTKASHISFESQQLQLGVGLSSTNIPTLSIKNIFMQRPLLKVDIYQQEKNAYDEKNTVRSLGKEINLELLRLDDASIHFQLFKPDLQKIVEAKTIQGSFTLNDVNLDGGKQAPILRIANLSYHTGQLQAEIAAKLLEPGALKLKASNVTVDMGTKTWKMHLDSVWLTDAKHTFYGKKKDSIQFSLKEIGLADIPFAKGDSIKWKELISKNSWWVRGGNVNYKTPVHNIMLAGLHLDHGHYPSFAYDSMMMLNRIGRDSFWKAQPFEKDFITLSTGPAQCAYFKISFLDKTPYVEMRSLGISHLFIKPERDKRRPDDTVSYRPLLARQIMGIPVKLKIDTLHLTDGTVEYHEIADKSGQEGIISFKNLTGNIANVRTYDPSFNDTLSMLVAARLYGTAPLNLRFRQSYFDTLQEFTLGVNMGQMDMAQMNTLLTPLLGIKIESGILDSMSMAVKGNKYFAFGTTKMPIRKMKVSVMSKEGNERKGISSIANWFVNKALGKKTSGERKPLFKERMIGKGQFNFWGKIAVEGLLTNLGIKGSKKEMDAFEKGKKERNLPNNYWQDMVPPSKQKKQK